MKEIEYCTCQHSSGVYPETNDFGHWDVCSDCNKPIQDSFEYFNTSEDDSEPFEDDLE